MSTAASKRIDPGTAHLEWVPIDKMKTSPRAQRRHDTASSNNRIRHIADNFDPDKFGNPTVNLREGSYWILDGAHRVLALLLLGYDDQSVQCWVHTGLSEEDEAEKFLSLNDVKPVAGMEKFRTSVVAKRETEVDIERIVLAAGLSIGSGRDAIGSVGALAKTYERSPAILASTLRAIRDGFGSAGFTAKVIEGTGLFILNYENSFDIDRLITQLRTTQGGVSGLVNRAEQIRKQYGISLAISIAATEVEVYNRSRGAKLNGWWSTFNGTTG